MKLLNQYIKNKYDWSICFFIIYIISCFLKLLYSLIQEKSCVFSDGLNEYLLNYQGGFVRRGLIGEILYQIYNYSGVNIYILIKSLSLFAITYIGYKLFVIMKDKGLSPILAFMPVSGITLYLFHFNYAGCRKDPILLIVLYICYSILNQIFAKNDLINFIKLNLFIILGILLHEAFIFFSLPIIGISIIYIYSNHHKKYIVLLRSILYLSPTIIILLLCAINKGDYNSSIIIWNSWKAFFSQYDVVAFNTPVYETLSASIKSLAWTAEYAFNFHITSNFKITSFGIPSWLYWGFSIIAYYFLMMHPNIFYKEKQSHLNSLIFSNILIFSFICMIPMFTVLSCDFSRSFVFLSVSVIMAYCILPTEKFGKMLDPITSTSKIALSFMQCKLFCNIWFLRIFALFVSVPACTFDLTDAIKSSIIGVPIGLVIEFINHIF